MKLIVGSNMTKTKIVTPCEQKINLIKSLTQCATTKKEKQSKNLLNGYASKPKITQVAMCNNKIISTSHCIE